MCFSHLLVSSDGGSNVARAIGLNSASAYVLNIILEETVNKNSASQCCDCLQLALWPLLFAAIHCCRCELIIAFLSAKVPAGCVSVQSPQLL